MFIYIFSLFQLQLEMVLKEMVLKRRKKLVSKTVMMEMIVRVWRTAWRINWAWAWVWE